MKEYKCDMCGTLNSHFNHVCKKCGYPQSFDQYNDYEYNKIHCAICQAFFKTFNSIPGISGIKSIDDKCSQCLYNNEDNITKYKNKFHKICKICGTSNLYLHPKCRKCGHGFNLTKCPNCCQNNPETFNECIICSTKLEHTQENEFKNNNKIHNEVKLNNRLIPDEIKIIMKYFSMEFPVEKDKLKTQYHKMIAKYHPDKYFHLGNEISTKRAEQKTKEIMRH